DCHRSSDWHRLGQFLETTMSLMKSPRVEFHNLHRPRSSHPLATNAKLSKVILEASPSRRITLAGIPICHDDDLARQIRSYLLSQHSTCTETTSFEAITDY